MSIKNVLAILTLGLVSSAPVVAHHAFCAEYSKQQITITGTVTKLEWQNPHTFIYIDVKPESTFGRGANWVVLLGNPHALGSRTPPVTRDTFKVGDQLTVRGNPARDGTPRLGECINPQFDIVAHTPVNSKPKP
jgi:hypothetical protein